MRLRWNSTRLMLGQSLVSTKMNFGGRIGESDANCFCWY